MHLLSILCSPNESDHCIAKLTVCFLSSVGTVQQGSPYEFIVKLLMKTACKITTISMPIKKDNLHIMSICLEGLRVSLIPALGVQSKL